MQTEDRKTSYMKMDALARDILSLSRSTLLVALRFMDMALSMLTPEALPEGKRGTIATDGERLIYDPRFVLRSYREEKERPVRDYLHLTLHCVFHHPFVDSLVDRKAWDLACDIAVEGVIGGLDVPAAKAARGEKQRIYLEMIGGEAGALTAERIYAWLRRKDFPQEYLDELSAVFRADDHSPWYSAAARTGGGDAARKHTREGLRKRWDSISHRMQADLESFSKKRGDRAGGLMQGLKTVNRERYDYSEFLRSFAVPGEAMKIDDDEFDYIFYTYGMELYGNMPLVEPLEYKEVRRIREFVVAIDTSGSVQGALVQRFITKTYNILMQEESFFTKINLHIIQCDARVQEDVKITCREEFDGYLAGMKIHGLGGTDFRPVFDYVEKLRLEGEFTNLKGLIYFTDGKGVYPEYMPEYPAAFVFVEESTGTHKVPVWAVKLVLQPEEI